MTQDIILALETENATERTIEVVSLILKNGKGDKRKMKRLTNAEKAELHKKLEEAEKAKFKPYENKIAELEKENAELKEQNRKLLESCEGATMMYKDLCKAKEIIKKYLSIGVGGKITQNYLDVTKEAEQFLRESK
jgi:predicted nuclease with TOPRIM domain